MTELDEVYMSDRRALRTWLLEHGERSREPHDLTAALAVDRFRSSRESARESMAAAPCR